MAEEVTTHRHSGVARGLHAYAAMPLQVLRRRAVGSRRVSASTG